MISNDKVKEQLKSDWAHKVLPTDVARVIIPLKEGVDGKTIDYIEWDGSTAQGNGFMFYNATDDRGQFLSANDGIIIGHEGDCPEGPNGSMISRSQAVSQYLKNHPDALSDEEHLQEFIAYLQKSVFRHDLKDPKLWDANAKPDIWCSNKAWLKKNFNETDILSADGSFLPVISATKKSETQYDVVYFGPNVVVNGIGQTGDRGSWAVQQPDGVVNLCTEEVFNKTYRPTSKGKAYYDPYLKEMVYPKGSLRHMPETQQTSKSTITLEERIARHRKQCEKFETPVFRVLGRAILDEIEMHPKDVIRKELEFNSLIAHDRNELSLTVDNPKSNMLKDLLKEGIIDDKGKILDMERFASSELVKNYKGKNIDLSKTPTIVKLKPMVGNKRDTKASR